MKPNRFTSAMLAVALLCVSAAAAAIRGAPEGKPEATIDLTTEGGLRLVKGEWRYSDTKIIEVDFRRFGYSARTYDYTPHAGAADFDDSRWAVLSPATLKGLHGGNIWFNWYRIKITIPTRVESLDPTGTTVVLETTIDDYAEVWVDGELPRYVGQSGGSVISGWNFPNRVVIGRNVTPGQQIQVAVFGINGPISAVPNNAVFMRNAKLDFYREPAPVAVEPAEMLVDLEKVDGAIDSIVPGGVSGRLTTYKLADGFQSAGGGSPVWVPEGYLLFSDPKANTIYRYTPDGGRLTVYRQPSGYSGLDVAGYPQPGSNGLALDPQGRLTIAEMGNRRVTRIERDGSLTVLADMYEGRRLNSPHDLVYRSDGTLYFTDPPFGLPKEFDDPRKELPYSGVFSLDKDKLQLISNELPGPHGIALSPDEKHLYVTNNGKKKIIMRYKANADGTLSNGTVFFDMTNAPGSEELGGIKVDQQGNLYIVGPGGVWILSGDGKHLGTILPAKGPRSLAWGDAEGTSLYLCTPNGLYRIVRLGIPGVRPGRPGGG